jgi:hypothetical protein
VSQTPIKDFFKDPRRASLAAVGVGMAKGALVGLAIGKLGLGVAGGIAGGAAVGAYLSWRARHQREAAAC